MSKKPEDSAASSSSAQQNLSNAAKKVPDRTQNQPAKPAASRQVAGKATTLGAGTFAGGKDITAGLYDVTPGAGQSGNFIVNGDNSYNEVLGVSDGLGVSKVRAHISDSDQIQISGLSKVTFTPVTTAFVTSQTTTNLYAGTFTVGQDVAAGRYTVTPGSGMSGNFIVHGINSYNEVLGNDSSLGEVPSLTATLSDGDSITISGLDKVIFTPAN